MRTGSDLLRDSLLTVAITIVRLHHYIVDRQFVLTGFGVMLFFVLSSYFGTRSLLQLKFHVERGGATAAVERPSGSAASRRSGRWRCWSSSTCGGRPRSWPRW